MNRFPDRTRSRVSASRFSVLIFAFVIAVAGCGGPGETKLPALPPNQFSAGGMKWQLHEGVPSKADNKLIGSFFKKNSNLIGSPDWTGDPQKYVCESSNSLIRFYWFSGTTENATWNALEFKGGRFRQLNGVGLPGVESNKE
jgi:hypothetical protein